MAANLTLWHANHHSGHCSKSTSEVNCLIIKINIIFHIPLWSDRIYFFSLLFLLVVCMTIRCPISGSSTSHCHYVKQSEQCRGKDISGEAVSWDLWSCPAGVPVLLHMAASVSRKLFKTLCRNMEIQNDLHFNSTISCN